MSNDKQQAWHRRVIEPNAGLMAVLTTVVISVGGLVEIAPMFSEQVGPDHSVAIEPYTALEIAGRDIYVREGCYLCHSQMVRPMRSETMRYGGEWSRAYEYQYDHPFLLGSRRIGPDLHRVGGKYPDSWHYEHMRDPRSTSPGSVMPTYEWLLSWKVDPADVQASMTALQTTGVPYTDEQIAKAPEDMDRQAGEIVGRLADAKITAAKDDEIVAVIAYLQRLGKDKPSPVAAGTVE
jgi:cytochrome c oxidase cbb3-type subunit I/II